MSEEVKEFKADHFENIEELVKTCKMWVTDDDYDAYCRFFDMGALEEILNYISNLQKENEKYKKELDKKDKVIDYLAEKLEEKSKSMTKGKWKIVAYNQVEKVGGEDE